jgi:hypothetical protein
MKQKLVIVTILLLFFQNINSQCAMCKAVVENGDHKMAEGINTGIVYLMVFPYLFLALGAYFFYRKYKRNKNNL